MFTGVNSSLSSKILTTIADADVGLSGMTYLHSIVSVIRALVRVQHCKIGVSLAGIVEAQ